LLCDPQTSGGLLIAVEPEGEAELAAMLLKAGLYAQPIGELLEQENDSATLVEVL
jgi:selenide,water dikinase